MKIRLRLAILAVVILSSLGVAQSVQRKAIEKKQPTKTTEKATATRPLDLRSRELQKIYEDEKFLDACTVLATSGEMFLSEGARITGDEEKFTVSFNVVNEVSRKPGQYKQLVYAFDSKDSFVYFSEDNKDFIRVKYASGNASKIKLPPWPPKWTPPKWTPPSYWPGSGGGTIGVGGGFEWDDWQEVSVECHWSLICPVIQNKMRQEKRTSKLNPWVTQTRWILIHCGC